MTKKLTDKIVQSVIENEKSFLSIDCALSCSEKYLPLLINRFSSRFLVHHIIKKRLEGVTEVETEAFKEWAEHVGYIRRIK